jgi:SAM-dependent methyltransferase
VSSEMRQEALGDQQREWEEIAGEDALWAILSYSDRKFGAWDREEFFRTGEAEIAELMASAEELGRPVGRRSALDFGCGVGRLTRALSERFESCLGLDISETMVNGARELNADRPGCSFEVNSRADLHGVEDGSFDLIFTRIVLQHQPSRAAIEGYLDEFLRTLKEDGLLVFQLPSAIPLAVRLQPRRRVYLLLRRLGFRSKFLYWKLGLHPMRMRHVPKDDVIAFLRSRSAKVLRVDTSTDPSYGFEDSLYYVTKS